MLTWKSPLDKIITWAWQILPTNDEELGTKRVKAMEAAPARRAGIGYSHDSFSEEIEGKGVMLD